MNIDAQRSIWPAPDARSVMAIDQRALPHRSAELNIRSVAEMCEAISDMAVRGAPLIGASAAYGVALQCLDEASDSALQAAKARLDATRPTAVNLAWATQRMLRELMPLPGAQRVRAAWAAAAALAEEDVQINRRIGEHGLALLRALKPRRSDGRLNVLTHCNAGRLGTVAWGTATAPLYLAQMLGLRLHVWVDETRPRNQGASLTAWELHQAGIDCTLIADNAGGHLMQHGQVDAVIVGCDRVTAQGDVCNKIGTYLKALAARDNAVPFYVAMPTPTLDRSLNDGLREIPIEERAASELSHVEGLDDAGTLRRVRLSPEGVACANPAFDVTPARYVTGLITEHGVVPATAEGLASLPHGY
jgi:methylthioribose-1-phosphate isomerase